MSEMHIFDEASLTIQNHFDTHAQIAEHLVGIGIGFERWHPAYQISEQDNEQTILQAYDADVQRLKAEHGYQSVDIVRMLPDHPQKGQMREKFLSEHTHSEDEVRFFVEGSGLFFLHIKDRIYRIVCVAGDLIRIPDKTKHWFDMGEQPFFTAIRLFTNPEGWVAEYTGDKIANKFIKDRIDG